MDIKTKEIYSEVNGVLNMLGENYINKLPKSLYNMVISEKLDFYNPTYDGTIALDKQNIKRESISMIALFHLNYWCENETEKNELRQLFKENEDKYQAELREKYNPDNLFKNRTSAIIQETETIDENVAMVEYKEQGLFKRIIEKIKRIFKRR